MRKIIHFLMTVNIFIAMAIPIIISIVFAILWFSILHILFGDSFPDIYRDIGGGIASIIFGLCGMIQLVRREAPGFSILKPFRGTYAIINGIIITLVFEGLGIVLIITSLVKNNS